MKFGKRLAAQIVQEWASHYVDYKLLKKRIKSQPICFDVFVSLLQTELDKVNLFYAAKSQEFMEALDELTGVHGGTHKHEYTDEQKAKFRDFCSKLNRFRAYIVLNYMAVIKIVKKWNKRDEHNNNNNNAPTRASLDAFAILHSSPFYHSRSLGQLVVKAEMMALCFSPKGPECAERKNFTCPVCLEVLVDPVVLGCAHRFCYHCISQNFETSDCCPVCRKRQLLEDGVLQVDQWLADFVQQHMPQRQAQHLPPSRQRGTDPEVLRSEAKKRVTVNLPTKSKKVIFIGVAGVRPDAIAFAKLDHIQNIIKTGRYSLTAKVGVPNSGACWATVLTGCREQRHGIAGDVFCKKEMLTPTILRALQLKGCRTAAVSSWRQINTLVEGEADLSMVFSTDHKVCEAVSQLLTDPACPDAIFVHFDLPVVKGREHGFSPTCQEYLQALEDTDARIGKLLAHMKQRQDEDWLTVLTSDYAPFPKVVASSSEPGVTFMAFVNQAIEPSEVVIRPCCDLFGPRGRASAMTGHRGDTKANHL